MYSIFLIFRYVDKNKFLYTCISDSNTLMYIVCKNDKLMTDVIILCCLKTFLIMIYFIHGLFNIRLDTGY